MNDQTRQNVIDYQFDRLHPLLKQLGYTGPVKRLRARGRDDLLCIEVYQDPEVCVTGQAKVVLYNTDSYPTTKGGEAILTAWGWTGRDSPQLAKKIAEHFTKNGINARATTYRKFHVVAFDPGDWINTPPLSELQNE